MFVDICIEQSFTTSVASVLIHVGDQPVIEAGFTSTLRIKGLISIEEGTLDSKPQTLHGFEGGL